MTGAVLYARVSSQEQADEGFSIPAQLKLLQSYASEHGFELMREFVDVETAKRTGRPGFQQMVDFLQSADGEVILLVEKTDRLYRNFRDYVTLDELDLEIHFVKENFVLSEDSRSSEKFMHGIKVLMAKNYVDNLSEEASKGMRAKAEQGTWPSCAPIGYRNVTIGNRRAVALDQVQGPIVRKLFECYALQTYSLAELTTIAAEEGLRTNRGGVPSKSTIHRMLSNPFYVGRFTWGGKEYEGDHPPLVSEDLFQRVQEALNEGHHGVERRKRTFAYTGLITCAHCGCSITAGLHKRKYVYYRCTGARGDCEPQLIREDRLEELLGGLVQAVQIDEEVVSWAIAALRESHGEEQAYHDAQVDRLQSEVKRLQRRLDQAYEDRLDGRVSEDQWQRVADKWRGERSTLLRSIEAHENANDVYLDAGSQLLGLAQRAYDLWLTRPQEERRKLLDILLLNCSFDGERLRPTYRKPFCWLAEGPLCSVWRG